jgi:hypothetical protein
MDTTFPRLYQCRKLTELPNSSIPRFYYPGASEQGGGDGILLEVSPEQGRPWLGIFAFGRISPRGVTGIFTTPDPHRLCVVMQGDGYLVSANNPTSWEDVREWPILDVRPVKSQQLLIFADDFGLTAYGETGIRWRTEDLVVDELVITEVTDTHIRGRGWIPEGEPGSYCFSVDLKTGEHEKWHSAVKKLSKREKRRKLRQLDMLHKRRQLILLQEIIAQLCPELLGRVQSAGIDGLSREERETLADILLDEFLTSGLREDYEPNPRGLEIDQLIDVIRKPIVDGTL